MRKTEFLYRLHHLGNLLNYAMRLFKSITLIFVASFLLSACGSPGKKHDAYKDMSAAKIYEQGKAQAKKKRYIDAIKDFEALEARFPYGEYTEKAQLALMHAYFENGDAASALASADRFIRTRPRHRSADYAYYIKGIVNYNENFSKLYQYIPLDRSERAPNLARQSFDDFKLLIQKFPNSEYVADARQRMVHLRNQLAEYELHVADYYLQKKAYLAAANRAGYVVAQYDQSSSIPQALVIMVKSYRALGMHSLAKDSYLTLEKNFPNSEFIKELS